MLIRMRSVDVFPILCQVDIFPILCYPVVRESRENDINGKMGDFVVCLCAEGNVGRYG